MISDETMRQRLGEARAYCLMILKKTPKLVWPDVDPIIWEHGRRNMALGEAGLLSIVCPVGDESDVAGIIIFNVDLERARQVMAGDPGVQEGILTYELHPCRGFPGSAGATRQQFADAGRTLIAKAPAVTNQGYFAKTEFRIDLEARSCTCPAAQVTLDVRGGKQPYFQFAPEVCGACRLRPQCIRGHGGRTVQFHPQEALLQQARRLQTSPPFRDYQRRRQVVEHRLARLVQLGLPQARYRGRAKTLFQLLMAAAVANLTLLASNVHGVWRLLLALPGLVPGLLTTLPALTRELSFYPRSQTRAPLSFPSPLN